MNKMKEQADALVRQGFKGHNFSDGGVAEAAYRQALALQPDHATALQLLGLLARRRGQPAEAESLFRRSLASDPAQPHVLNNLGNLLAAEGRADDALQVLDRALSLHPTYADAQYNRARVLQGLGRLADAEQAAHEALKCAPAPTAALLQLRGQIEADLGQVAAAMDTVDQALKLAPDKPALLHNRATLLQRTHQPAQALDLLDRALSLGLDAADAHYNRGSTLQSLGRFDEAAAAYRRALQRQPGHALALYDLARLRWRRGEADFDAELIEAAAADPASAQACGMRAQMLWRAERYADAAAVFEQALARAPGAAPWLDGLGRCLVRLGQHARGLQAHERAIAAQGAQSDLRVNWASSLLIAGQSAAAAEQAQAAIALAPLDQQAWALLGTAWRLLGDPRAVWLHDAVRLVSVVDLAPPAGFESMAAFNAALAQELAGLHLDLAAPVDQTLRRGTQTLGKLFEQGHVLVDALKQRISEAVAQYIAALPAESAHPFLSRRAAGWRFSDSWSSRLYSGGFHTNHVHPHGWISSAYYVAVPPAVKPGAPGQGWLQFGQPDFDVEQGLLPKHQVHPVPGRLVLFPSMMWHGTTPFEDEQFRLTIAFDVMPS